MRRAPARASRPRGGRSQTRRFPKRHGFERANILIFYKRQLFGPLNCGRTRPPRFPALPCPERGGPESARRVRVRTRRFLHGMQVGLASRADSSKSRVNRATSHVGFRPSRSRKAAVRRHPLRKGGKGRQAAPDPPPRPIYNYGAPRPGASPAGKGASPLRSRQKMGRSPTAATAKKA